MWKDNDLLQDMIDGHFKFYKHVNDDPEFAKVFLDLLFERYIDKSKKGPVKRALISGEGQGIV